jgi:hypothetical protein
MIRADKARNSQIKAFYMVDMTTNSNLHLFSFFKLFLALTAGRPPQDLDPLPFLLHAFLGNSIKPMSLLIIFYPRFPLNFWCDAF